MKTLQKWLSNLGQEYTLEELSNLIRLDLDYNKLTSIPKELGNLGNLIRLDLENNQLTSIPKEIGNLSNLQELYLNKNELTGLPKEIALLGNLRRLYVHDNPNLVLFEDQAKFCTSMDHHSNIEKLKVVPRNANTDILFG